jgi:F0F1-type ATP synthase membrane subunit a
MRTIVFRILGGAVGLFAALVATLELLLFVSNELQEMESMREYGGHVSFWGAVGSSLVVLIALGLLACAAFVFLRFSFRGPKSKAPATELPDTRLSNADVVPYFRLFRIMSTVGVALRV